MPNVLRRSVWFAPLILVAALAAGCAGRGTTPPPDGEMMRIYYVPDEHFDAAWKALNGAVQEGPPGSRIERLPDGRLFLVAPVAIHERAEALVRELATTPPIRAAELDYWIVLGEPAAAPSEVAGMAEIAPALQSIVAEQGPMKFTLLETSRLSSMLDESASAQGNLVQVRQVVSIVAGLLVAEVSIDLRIEQAGNVQHRNLMSRVNFRPGRPLVLGQSGYTGDPRSTVFYVLRGEVMRED